MTPRVAMGSEDNDDDTRDRAELGGCRPHHRAAREGTAGPGGAGGRGVGRDGEAEWGEDVYTVLLFILTHLDFPRDKAREQWGRILRQW